MPRRRTSTAKPPLRIYSGSLQGLKLGQLAKLKAEACAALESRWRRENQPATRSRGRPNSQAQVFAACAHIQKRMGRRKQATLGKWYQAVAADLGAHALALSAKTIKKFVREWLGESLPLDKQPEGIGPYLINAQQGFNGVRWLLLWSGLCAQFPDVQTWLKAYQNQHGACPGELPHEILPSQLQTKIKMCFDAPLGPPLYDHLVRESLRNATEE